MLMIFARIFRAAIQVENQAGQVITRMGFNQDARAAAVMVWTGNHYMAKSCSPYYQEEADWWKLRRRSMTQSTMDRSFRDDLEGACRAGSGRITLRTRADCHPDEPPARDAPPPPQDDRPPCHKEGVSTPLPRMKRARDEADSAQQGITSSSSASTGGASSSVGADGAPGATSKAMSLAIPPSLMEKSKDSVKESDRVKEPETAAVAHEPQQSQMDTKGLNLEEGVRKKKEKKKDKKKAKEEKIVEESQAPVKDKSSDEVPDSGRTACSALKTDQQYIL